MPVVTIAPAATTTTGTTTPTVAPTSNLDKLELARKLAQKINLQHNSVGGPVQQKGASQQAAEFIMKGGMIQPTISAKTVAEQVRFHFISLFMWHGVPNGNALGILVWPMPTGKLLETFICYLSRRNQMGWVPAKTKGD